MRREKGGWVDTETDEILLYAQRAMHACSAGTRRAASGEATDPLSVSLSCTNNTLEQKLKNQFVLAQTTQGNVKIGIMDIATITKIYENIANWNYNRCLECSRIKLERKCKREWVCHQMNLNRMGILNHVKEIIFTQLRFMRTLHNEFTWTPHNEFTWQQTDSQLKMSHPIE